MKNALMILLLAALTLASCEKYPFDRFYRNELFPSGGSSDEKEDGPSSDTTMFISAVLVPGSYDWRRDTAYGYPTCELMLLKNGIKEVSMRTGPAAEVSPTPSTHHIIGGHLYTEYSSSTETVVKKDGALCFRYQGAEVLFGLLPIGSDIYTIGRERDGDGFTFRKNGELMLKQSSGTIFGGFTHPAYGRTGALYENEGHCCFCFKTDTDCYKVIDGVMERVSAIKGTSRIMDLRVYGNSVCYSSCMTLYTYVNLPDKVYTLSAKYLWTNVELMPVDDEIWFIGSAYKNGEWFTIFGPAGSTDPSSDYCVFQGKEGLVYHDGRDAYCVDISSGGVKVMDPGESYCYSRDSCFFFSPSCAAMAGNSLFMTLTPKEKELAPIIWHDGEERAFDLQGYLTGIELEISP